MKDAAERLVKIFEWGDKNDVVVRVARFKQFNKQKEQKRYYEVALLIVDSVSNAGHRSFSGKAETLDDALNLAWKDYKKG